ncbi:glycoside hydrolase family 125 protein [Novosphingobium sp.]|uniref:glycoside hydrolase family 125 protein n=1 Tax=Novosphingobium sp. TaxID=1874826 RepID=UPI0025F4F8FB|nr:glycoside hydrolase family 125 protein [Novosphingobium sp.]MCC6925473.1 glycoside hydrolase family 125 protein [Novosphingobium sp.]
MLFAGQALRAQEVRMFQSNRPPLASRRFVSAAVEREIDRVSALIRDPELRWLFANCYPNTLDTTVFMGQADGHDDAFVITGDIDALWLRDSAAQVRPYLHLARSDAQLRTLYRGLIRRHARCVLLDPYANAFTRDPASRDGLHWSRRDKTEMKPGVAERKWEVDSLCYVLRLAHDYWRESGDVEPFDATWAKAARTIVATFKEQQRVGGPGPYRFQRNSDQPTETTLAGIGVPTRKTGLIHSAFRPSDDACTFPCNIPGNLFAVATLRELAEMAGGVLHDAALAAEALALADEVEKAVYAHGTMQLPDGRRVFAYETDGYGNHLFMDDANVPSLLGLAYLRSVPADSALYQTTAQAVWSDANPWFFKGRAAEGIGGPHIGEGQVWPMSIILRALSSSDDAVIAAALQTLRATHAGTGFMHEAFDKDDPARFTRKWFAWVNGLFGELVVKVANERPHLLAADFA